jgi:hypothetical protein
MLPHPAKCCLLCGALCLLLQALLPRSLALQFSPDALSSRHVVPGSQ